MKLIYVPRDIAPSVWKLPWVELCALAEVGERGIRLANGSEGYVLMREGTSADRQLVGRSLLYFQAWVSHEPPIVPGTTSHE